MNVPQLKAEDLARELDAIGLRVGGSPFWRGTVACSGSEFCKLAITETKNFSRWLVEELEDRLPGFDQHLKLHVTGCPNSCGQHWIADIGIDGKKIKVDGQMVDAYYFCLGGSARSPSGDGAASWISLPCDRSSGMRSSDCSGNISPTARRTRTCVSSLPGTPIQSCGNFWLARRRRRRPRFAAGESVGRLAQAAGGDGD